MVVVVVVVVVVNSVCFPIIAYIRIEFWIEFA